MIEPPARGFTGVVWEARPAEKLATDLLTGKGTAPMAEAVAAWTRLSAQFGTAALDFDRIVAELRQAWQSDNSAIPLERLTVVRDWLLEAADAATANATRVAEHIATHELAKTVMPHPEEVAALVAAQRMLAQVSAALGAPLVAFADDTELQQDKARTSAARVMRTYEVASERLAAPWQQPPPPVVAPETALRAEHAANTPPRPAAAPRTAVARFPRLPMNRPPREPGAYRHSSIAQTSTAPTAPATTTSSTPSDTGSGRMLPGTAASAAAASAGDERNNRAGDATPYRADPTDIAESIQAAPAVLGAAGPPHEHAPSPQRTGEL